MIKFSVIIPVYNTERYLTRCLGSLFAYKGDDLEVIALDDGSTDGSLALLQAYPDKRLKTVHKENEGAFKTWKLGVSLARGEYIVFVDSDDYVSEALFPALKKALEGGEYDLIQYGWTLFGDKQKTVAELPYPALGEGAYTGEPLQRFKEKYIYVEHYTDCLATSRVRWGKAFRAEKLKALLPRLLDSIKMFEDDSVVIPFMLEMDSLYILHEPLYFYWFGRVGSVCNSPEKFEDYLRDANAVCSYFSREEFGIPARSLDCYYLHYHLDVLWHTVLAKEDDLAELILGDERFQRLLRAEKGLKSRLLLKKRFKLYRFLRNLRNVF